MAVTRGLARARGLVSVFFWLDGFLFANWVVRVPQVKVHVDASASGLGLALLGVSAGAVVTMMITGRLCARYGSRHLSLASAVALALATALPALMPTVLTLGAALTVFGAAYGGLNVAMNSVAVDITRRLGRPVMPTFHAAYSFGGLSGAVIGGLAAEVLGPAAHLALAGACGLVVAVATGVPLLRSTAFDEMPAGPSRADADNSAANRGRAAGHIGAANRGRAADAVAAPPDAERATPVAGGSARLLVGVFGTIALCTAYGEGALADWGALHLRADLHTTPGLAAAAYGGFSVAMLAGRLTGTWLLGTVGQTRALVAGGFAAAAGMLLAAFAPTLPLAIAGFIVVGLGLANLFPTAIARAGALTGPNGVAAASTIGYAGMLLGPPVIGFLADRTSLPVALTSIALLAALAAGTALLASRIESRRVETNRP